MHRESASVGAAPAVCMLVYSYHPEATGGAERQCRLQSVELVRQGHACLVLTTRQQRGTPRWTVDQGCEVIRCPTAEFVLRRLPSLRRRVVSTTSPPAAVLLPARGRAAGALRWLNAASFMAGAGWILFRRRKQLDVLHAHGADWHAGFAGWIGRRLSIPVVCKGANVPVFPDLAGIPFGKTWDAWRRRIHHVALTPAMRDDLLSNGVPADRISVLPNGVEIPDAVPADLAEPLVLHVANYTQPAWNKALDVLFDAWPQVVRACPAARLVTAGAGDVSLWRQRVEQDGVGASVNFVGYCRELDAWYRQAAVFVLPSRREGISNALLEAQARGVPAVVSDIAGNRAVVVEDETGLVAPVGDAAALARALILLLSDLALRRRMGNAARLRIRSFFGIETVVRELGALYRQLVCSGRS